VAHYVRTDVRLCRGIRDPRRRRAISEIVPLCGGGTPARTLAGHKTMGGISRRVRRKSMCNRQSPKDRSAGTASGNQPTWALPGGRFNCRQLSEYPDGRARHGAAVRLGPSQILSDGGSVRDAERPNALHCSPLLRSCLKCRGAGFRNGVILFARAAAHANGAYHLAFFLDRNAAGKDHNFSIVRSVYAKELPT
jgi:hypothetical protein